MTHEMLSAHFTVAEIFGTHEPSEDQLFLARNLCNELLEPLRKILETPLYVSDGFRSWERYKDLQKRGYKPYRWSDHSYMIDWNPYGVGAVDVLKLTPTRGGHSARVRIEEDEFNRIVAEMQQDNWTPWGQLIWYRGRGHIHVSNPRELVFSHEFIQAHGFPRRQATYIKED